MHFRDPVTQAVHHQLQRRRMHGVQRVSGAGVIDVMARIFGVETIVDAIVDAAKRQRRAELIAFGRVVIDDVEHDFDPGRVQRLDHRLEFVDRIARGITRVRREKADAVVAPVVAQAALDQRLVVDELVNGHQLDRGDAQALQMRDHRRGRQAGIGSAKLRPDRGMQLREALDVQFVDDRVLPRRLRPDIVAPGERGVDHAALGHRRCAVARIERQVFAPAADAISVVRVGPAQRPGHQAGVRVEQQLVRVEPIAALRRVRTVHAVAVELARDGLRAGSNARRSSCVRERRSAQSPAGPWGRTGTVRRLPRFRNTARN